MANSNKQHPYIVIAEYIDKNTGKRHVVGDEVKLTDKRADEILSHPRRLIKALDDHIVANGVDGSEEILGEAGEDRDCDEERAEGDGNE